MKSTILAALLGAAILPAAAQAPAATRPAPLQAVETKAAGGPASAKDCGQPAKARQGKKVTKKKSSQSKAA